MKLSVKIPFVTALALASSLACSTEAVETPAPEASLGAIELADEGTSYDGWTQSVGGTWCQDLTAGWFDHSLAREYGDATRGGGGCAVTNSGEACSSDATCTTSARSMYGTSAYGYCYSGTCFYRPGSPPSYCVTGSDRGNGSALSGSINFPFITGHVLGCMTKAAGPSADCGSTNTSLYMRTMNYVTVMNCMN